MMKKKQALLDNNNSSFVYKKIRQNRLKNRLKGGWLVFSLSTLSMVSIGFSTWVITGEGSSNNGQIDIVADDVYDYSKYFVFNENENGKDQPTEPFEYNSVGIIKDGLIGTSGDFSFYLAVTLRGNDALFGTAKELTSFSFDFLISDSGSFKILTYLSSASYTISNGSNSDTNNATLNKSSSPYSLLTTCTNTTLLQESKLFYKVTLSFEFDSIKSSFGTEFDTNMQNANLSFSIRYGG